MNQRGSSGARVVIDAAEVRKYGDIRVHQQGAWLRRHADIPCLPIVHAYTTHTVHRSGLYSYNMETLYPVDVSPDDGGTSALLDRVSDVAYRHLWSRPAECSLININAHIGWREQNLALATNRHRRVLDAVCRSIRWGALQRGLTHGDLIIDNVLQRADGQLVFIDPIPATPALPDVPVSDIGRLVQSAVNYEWARYDGGAELSYADVLLPLRTRYPDIIRDANDITATLYLAAVHALRGCRTAPDDATRALIYRTCVTRIMEELITWMPWFSLEDGAHDSAN